MADLNMANAVDLYRKAAQRFTGAGDATPVGPRPTEEFSSVLKDSIRTAIDVQKTGEEMSVKAVAGQADLAEVVTAVSNAELTLQTVVSVRDRVIQAYQDVMRMPI